MLYAVQHSMVFGCSTHCGTAGSTSSPKNCGVSAFSSATCENHFARTTSDDFSHHISCLVNHLTGFSRESMRPRWVCIHHIAVFAHGIAGLGAQRRGCSMIEIHVRTWRIGDLGHLFRLPMRPLTHGRGGLVPDEQRPREPLWR